MELAEAVKTRRSCRRFSRQALASGILEKIIEAGNCAPSHCNTQGWKFIFVDDDKIKESIFRAGGSITIKNAPYGVLVLYNIDLSDNSEYQDWLQSASAAIQNMLLTIHDLGLGGCWVCHLPNKRTLRKIFKIPRGYSPVAYLVFGYPKENMRPVPRQHIVADVLAFNRFIWPAGTVPFKIYFKRVLRKLYFILPSFLKKLLMPLTDKYIKKFSN
jgi:nitroreductase